MCTCLLAIHYIHVAIIRRITTISDNLRTRVVIKGHSRVICTNIPDFHAGPADVCIIDTSRVAEFLVEQRVTFLLTISLETYNTISLQLPHLLTNDVSFDCLYFFQYDVIVCKT